MTFHDVIELYGEVRGLQISENIQADKIERNGGKQIIRRPAGDSWF